MCFFQDRENELLIDKTLKIKSCQHCVYLESGTNPGQSSIQYRVNTWKDLLAAGDSTQECSSPFPLATHQLSGPVLHLHIEFHNMENKAVRWETNTSDVLILTMDSEFPAVSQEFQKFIDAFLDSYLPLFLPPSLACSFSPPPGGQRGKQDFCIFSTRYLLNWFSPKLMYGLSFKSTI